jgi:hypothetical protein
MLLQGDIVNRYEKRKMNTQERKVIAQTAMETLTEYETF